ncbi:hypothetical protein [Methylorubrum extorquens]|uniref:hypothetical protein n=1 Tax=Methylorubrum extorquens TaxID=408 RepID=UPI00030AB751|nr:hypothetical protein [Methylorubrum extorquens]
MPRRALMTEAQRDRLLAIPTDEATLTRHWVLGDEDLAINPGTGHTPDVCPVRALTCAGEPRSC